VTRRSSLVLIVAVLTLGCGGRSPSDPGPIGSPSGSNAPSVEPSGDASPAPSLAVLPSRLFAPYVEMWTGDRITDLAEASGQRYFTLAFLDTTGTDSCDVVWSGATKLTDVAGEQIAADIETLRAAGGDVIPSFGGYSADHEGRELADACDSAEAVADGYQSVIDHLGVSRLDMDVEVESLERPDGIARRNQAIRILQDRLADQGRAVQIQYTLPTTPDGLDSGGLAVLRSAVEHGADVDLVNIMAFDYYDGLTTDMGAAAITAARGLHRQLTTIYPDRTEAQLWAMIGLTIMNGVDDYPAMTEVTTIAHARDILAFATENGLRHLSMWATQRDNGSCPGGGAADGCSGIEQATWAFTKVLGPYTRP
jgi:Glycosyl hydrolases family 18